MIEVLSLVSWASPGYLLEFLHIKGYDTTDVGFVVDSSMQVPMISCLALALVSSSFVGTRN